MTSAASATHDSGNVDHEHPWIGLESFTEATRSYFYGRDDEVAELARRVQRKLLTVLFGQSGLGKTSILRAGIVPRLRPEGYCPVYVRIDYSSDAPSPSEQIKQAIFVATAAIGQWTQPGAASAGESLWEFLHHRDDILIDSNGKTVVPLLIFDQFEEIFTLAQADDAGRKRAALFIEDLADLVENRPPKALEARLEDDDTITDRFDFNREDYRILIALREDYLAHLESVKAAMPSITQNRMRLARMTGQQALSAVMKPGGKLVSQEVAEATVRFVAGGSELVNAEVEPSLLSLICRELNNTRIAQGKSEISADLLAGSHDTILAEFYERALADQPPAVRKVIEDELLTESGYRENLAEERLLKSFNAAGASVDSLPTLVNRRLLRIEERLDVRRVELTHDVLCGVVKASRAQRMERDAREAAEARLAQQKDRERATRKALIRARQIAIGCAALSVVAVASGAYGIYSARRAAVAETEAIKTRAISETSRGESEKLVVFILDDFYDEMAPIGRLDVLGGLAQKAVDYYAQLPPEARTPETQRNSALAQARAAQVAGQLGRTDNATTLVESAAKTIAELRSTGDNGDDTLIASARVGLVGTALRSNRLDFAAAAKSAETALATLAPVLAKPNPSKIARTTQAFLLSNLGNAQLRSANFAAAIENYTQARKIAAELGALDLSNLVAASGYVGSSWQLAEALANTGKSTEAESILQDAIALADKVLEKRPGHRPVLRAKATANHQLGWISNRNLRLKDALGYVQEAQRINEQVAALDPGNSGSRNNLRLTKGSAAQLMAQLGRVDDASAIAETWLVIDPSERLDGFSMGNLIRGHGDRANARAERGRPEAAAAELKKADQYRDSLLAITSDPVVRTTAPAAIAIDRARVDLVNGQFEQARLALEPQVASLVAAIASAGEKSALPEVLFQAQSPLAAALNQTGDYAGAAKAAQSALDFLQKERTTALSDQRAVSTARTALAMALARQGKADEANTVLKPALAFFKLPAVQQSDDETLKADHAQALFAAAVANPAEKKALLAEALRRIDALPATLKPWKSYARLRADIVREQQKK